MTKTEIEAHDRLVADANEILKPHGIRLADYADMCREHFCLQRDLVGSPGYVEHWVKGDRWSAFGTLIIGTEAALGRAMLVIHGKG
jgi:hypothetical protein